jgi:hypothetical protein
MRATFIRGSSACPSRPELLAGLAWTTASGERGSQRGDAGQRAKPSHRGLRRENLQIYMGQYRGNFAHFRWSKPFLLPISG